MASSLNSSPFVERPEIENAPNEPYETPSKKVSIQKLS